ncbi:MAG: polysaccharide lyase family 7 protein, partial [Verrucomicrobia bacterium]|nr:polysaccharide lyase family 7 protein [Verrucomicrobiota bacterium]
MPNLRRTSVLCLVTLVSLHLASPAARALDPNVPPGQNFDLTHWYLGLPVDSSGGTSGDSASISASQLVAGYSNALYFYTGADGAMTFWAPVTGATTSGSDYPRSELREQISPPSNDINWSGYGFHILNATCRVTQVPDSKKVIIGQIHTKTGDARPLVKLQYNNGTIEALVKVYASDTMPNTDNKLTFQNVGLNNAIN